jgi:hypothetical protein
MMPGRSAIAKAFRANTPVTEVAVRLVSHDSREIRLTTVGLLEQYRSGMFFSNRLVSTVANFERRLGDELR